MKKFIGRLSIVFSKGQNALNQHSEKLSEAELSDLKSALTEIELRDR